MLMLKTLYSLLKGFVMHGFIVITQVYAPRVIPTLDVWDSADAYLYSSLKTCLFLFVFLVLNQAKHNRRSHYGATEEYRKQHST